MGFLSPWFLAGAVAVGLPVWLHLLRRHKTDPRPFPSLMFFEKREQSSVVHRRFDYLLLFLLRALMLILLALLFANPFINRDTPKASGKKLLVVAVDNSFSMRVTAGGQSRLDQAKSQAQTILSGIPSTTAAQVIALGGTVQAMTQQTNDPAELKAAVAAIKPTDSRGNYGELARFTRTLSESSKMPIELHLVSDLQKSAMPPGFTDLRLAGDTTLILHSVGGDLPNWTVENVKAPVHLYDPKRVRIQATVTGFGTPAAKKTVTLLLNGKTIESKQVDVPAGQGSPGRAQVEFDQLPASYGFNRCEVKIDSGDALPGDDSFAFSVQRTDPKKILFVDDGRRPNAALYYKTALASSTDAAFALDVQRPETAATAKLDGYAMVLLDDLGGLPPGMEENLRRYVSSGKSLMVVLGPQSVAMTKVPVEGDAIQASNYASRGGQQFLTVSSTDTGHPVFKGIDRMEGVNFYQTVHVTPSQSARVVAKLNDQTPLVLERQIGEGKVLVFTSTFDNVSNDFPVHGAYWVPFVLQSATYLAGGGDEQPVNVAVDSYVELRTGDSKNAAAEVLDPDGKRALSLKEATSAKTFQLDREGFFDVKPANGQESLIAVHADRRESDMAMIPKENLDLWKATGSGDTGAEGPGGAAGQKTTPWSLQPVLLMLLLLVALAESAVADGYLRPKAERQEGARKAA